MKTQQTREQFKARVKLRRRKENGPDRERRHRTFPAANDAGVPLVRDASDSTSRFEVHGGSQLGARFGDAIDHRRPIR